MVGAHFGSLQCAQCFGTIIESPPSMDELSATVLSSSVVMVGPCAEKNDSDGGFHQVLLG